MNKAKLLTLWLLTMLCMPLTASFLNQSMTAYATPDKLPSDGDAWTENNNATYPWYNHPSYNENLNFTTTDVKVGSYALNISHTSASTANMVFLNCTPQDVKDYAVFSTWMKVINKTNWNPVNIKIWLTEDDSAEWYNQGRYKVTTNGQNNTWFRVVMPIRAFLADNSPTWCQFNYIGIEFGDFGSADNTTILIDGLHFATDFEYYSTSNQIDYKLLPNWLAWTWYNTKTQSYGGTNYTSYYSFVQTDWTHDYEGIESEILGQFVYAFSYIYKLKAYDFVKTRLDDIVTWLLTFQYLNETSAGHGGFYTNYVSPNHVGFLKDVYCGWILAGLSVYYSIEPTSNLKVACDLLRGFLCDTLWDSTNKWFDTSFSVSSQNVTDATSWTAMPNGAIMAGLGAYQRYVSTNSTVETIVGQSYTTGYNKVKDADSGASNRFCFDLYEPTMYVLHGCYQNWKALGNVTFKQEFLNLTSHVLANNMMTQTCSINNAVNGSAYAKVKFTSEPFGSERYFDGWGLACSLPLLMWLYDETANSHILDLVKTILYEAFPEGWGLTDFGGFSRYYGDSGTVADSWKDQMYVVGNTWIWWTALRWLDTQGISDPYILSTSHYNGITAYNYDNLKMAFTVNGTANSMTTTYVHCGDKGQPKSVDGARSWSYDYNSKICTVTVEHASSQQVVVSWMVQTTGKYQLTVGVIKGGLPVMGANVTCGGEPAQRTDLLGHTVFELPYGFYTVSVTVGEETQSKEVLVSQSMSVGFEFKSAPSGSRGFDADLILVPVVIFVIAFVVFMFMRKR